MVKFNGHLSVISTSLTPDTIDHFFMETHLALVFSDPHTLLIFLFLTSTSSFSSSQSLSVELLSEPEMI